MTAIVYASHYKCDRCGKETSGGRANVAEFRAIPPPGWMTGLEFIRHNGIPVHDICDDCALLPFGEVVKGMREDGS